MGRWTGYGSNQYGAKRKAAICWDCKKAAGFCSWSADGKPVEGWTAEPSVIALQRGEQMRTYCVIECPLFERDSWYYGQERTRKKGAMMDDVYRAVLRTCDGDCAETTGTLDEVIKWTAQYKLFLDTDTEIEIWKLEEGSEPGCIGIT